VTDEELAAIEARWSGGAEARVERDFVGAGLTVRIPYAGDVPALVAEVRRLRGALESIRDRTVGGSAETYRELAALILAGEK
jgi:hypothetical protein